MITQEHLKECLHYRPETGAFIWIDRPRRHFSCDLSWKKTNTQYSGRPAGHYKSHKGRRTLYIEIQINGKLYKAHRMAWLYIYGVLPSKTIDHIDGDGTNNKIENLRDVSQSENNKNRPVRKDNKSGVTGVTWCNTRRKWVASIRVNGFLKTLLRTNRLDEAVAARKSAEKTYDFHPNHGRTQCFPS